MEEIEKVLKEKRKNIIEEQIEVHLEEQIKEEASTHSMPTEADFSNTATQKDRKITNQYLERNSKLMCSGKIS